MLPPAFRSTMYTPIAQPMKTRSVIMTSFKVRLLLINWGIPLIEDFSKPSLVCMIFSNVLASLITPSPGNSKITSDCFPVNVARFSRHILHFAPIIVKSYPKIKFANARILPQGQYIKEGDKISNYRIALCRSLELRGKLISAPVCFSSRGL